MDGQFKWDVDKSFNFGEGNTINVLQRQLLKINKAIKDEFLPFYYEKSLFQIRDGKASNVVSKIGKFLKIEYLNDNLVLTFCPDDKKEFITYEIKKIIEIKMTAWRVNQTLDLLQININGSNRDSYLQTGGAKLLDIFGVNDENRNEEISINNAREIFLSNVLSK